MRHFGKRPNSADFASIVHPAAAPIPCKVAERTPRLLCLSVANPEVIPQRFMVVLNNGRDELFCELTSFGQNYVIARYASKGTERFEPSLTIGPTLNDAERWKGLR